MTDGADLLATILAEPDEDLHRLKYADWLQEHGDEERAEFIRVQIELARHGTFSRQHFRTQAFKELRREQQRLHDHVGAGRRPIRRDRLWSRAHAIGDARYDAHANRKAYLDGRAFELIDEFGAYWFGTIDGFRVIPCLNPAPDLVAFGCGDYNPAHVVRGFIASLTCSTVAWFAHADALLVQHPVRTVWLTRLPPLDNCGGVSHKGWLEYSREKWPGVEFELPFAGLLISLTPDQIIDSPFPLC